MPIQPCPNCGQQMLRHAEATTESVNASYYACEACGHVWSRRKDGSGDVQHLTPLKRTPSRDNAGDDA